MSLPDTITLPAGSTSQELELMALPDSIVEDVKMFSFTVDNTATAAVSIMDATCMFMHSQHCHVFLPHLLPQW